jgi:hypothetical protein
MTLHQIFAADLRGHDYIKARGLTPKPNRNHSETCQHCALQEMLPAVIQITERWPVPAKKMRRVK